MLRPYSFIENTKMPAHLKSLIPKLAKQLILVIGDVILDEYVIGQATRMSREAPVPVLEFESRQYIAGGSANPCANIVALGSQAILGGIIGNDNYGEQVKRVITRQDINTTGLIICNDRPTTVKTRIMAQMGLRFPQQVARIDTLSRAPIDASTETTVIEVVQNHIAQTNAVLLSDYHGGLLTLSLIRAIHDLCIKNGILLTADVQGNFDKYRGFDVLKCNADDAEVYLARELLSDFDYAEAARQLFQSLNLRKSMVITRGGDGATVVSKDIIHHCPAPAVSDVFDTVGAGDTSIAVLTLAYSAGIDDYSAVMLANYASGIVVRHVGNYAPTPDELLNSIPDD